MKTLQIGKNFCVNNQKQVKGAFTKINGEEFYVIEEVQQMEPFFMSIVSDTDHWMFISSNGALTAGRKNPENALFPYYTVDKIHDSAEYTGNKNIVRASISGTTYLWEPFSSRFSGIYNISRRLYKNISGNKLIFEETNHDLKLVFTYQWANSEKYGLVKKSGLKNLNSETIEADMLDGIQNILPACVNRSMQTSMSSLVDAYKKNELVPETGLGIFMLSSIPVDRAEPSETLSCNTVWSVGANIKQRLVSSLQLDQFRKGEEISQEYDIRGKRGAYFVQVVAPVKSNESIEWFLVAEVNQIASKVSALNKEIKENKNIAKDIEADIEKGTQNLVKIVASADGLQQGNDNFARYRQFSNVLFNVMRGGIFDNGYIISVEDLKAYASKANKRVYQKFEKWFNELGVEIHYSKLNEKAATTNDSGLIRLCFEYMPLTFSRRHGDPSRPWNLFSIETRKEDGSKNLNYQGNWRDIFQNWEALALSFPGFIESMISKFVNASTVDGYNPYRVTRDGFDWEIHDPSDPWSFIGYWGDHQIIYLCKLLEISAKYHPAILESFLSKEIFTYANVPYRIKEYSEILKNPFNTIDYDEKLEKLIESRVKELGSDGKVVWNKTNDLYYVNLSEKLLISMLAKLANFVPEGGIWMNTQRPEWNDANNALAGQGLSMVTLYYLRRYTAFCKTLYQNAHVNDIQLSAELKEFLSAVFEAMKAHSTLLQKGFDDVDRKKLLDSFAVPASEFRKKIYVNGFSEQKQSISRSSLIEFFDKTLEFIDQSIKANKRPDGLYHAYNVITVKADRVEISNLQEMLEGQVSVLSSGALSTTEAADLLQSLRNSAMFRADQHSYMLYPDKQLPRFIEKNNIPNALIEKSKLLKKLSQENDKSVIEKDVNGVYHFHSTFQNKNILAAALDKISASETEKQEVLDVYESMFHHKAFTGRSGTFYSFEGLGCIYWHMNAKLALVASEIYFQAKENNADAPTLAKLKSFFYDIKAGLGAGKSPDVYGAFPTDPYSHTPGHSGAQQPGMTGQVKEDIITRFAELGIKVSNGQIILNPELVKGEEFVEEKTIFKYFDVTGNESLIELDKGSMAFTYCQVPVILKKTGRSSVTIFYKSGNEIRQDFVLAEDISKSIFERKGEIIRIEVELAN